jgi:hypothetical protein
VSDFPVPLQIELLRADIADLSGAIHQLRRCGLDSASAERLIAWKRVELEGLLRQPRTGTEARARETWPCPQD